MDQTIKDSGNTPQLSLPSIPPALSPPELLPALSPTGLLRGAEIIELPLSTERATRDTPSHDTAAGALSRKEFNGKEVNGKELNRKKLNKQKQPSSLWYALYFPQLAELTESQQKEHLNRLAGLVQQISATVSLHPLALLCEVRSSLKYFGGIDAIHDKLKSSISAGLREQGLSEEFLYAASPTITGSLLLARSGHNTLVYQKSNLRSALGQLPSAVLQLDKEPSRRLHNMGVRYLKDIWRLPNDGLRKRFGSTFVNQLNKALGKLPEPIQNYLPPPAFTTSYELPYELDQLERLMPVADELLTQLCDYLRQRDLSTSLLLFSLLHEKRDSTEIVIGLRQPSRSQEHLMLLLETHIDNLTIPAPVTAVKIEVKKFDVFIGQSDSLIEEAKPANAQYYDHKLNQLMDKLQARLGGRRIKAISNKAEHCPEHASQQLDHLADNGGSQSKNSQVASNTRPFWLLPEPQKLAIRRGQLYHRRPISIVNGPERIESHWWSGTDVCRDYYVARDQNGSRLWIYRERTGERNWFLHGFFA